MLNRNLSPDDLRNLFHKHLCEHVENLKAEFECDVPKDYDLERDCQHLSEAIFLRDFCVAV
jgi:hypothetical protein